MRSLVLRASLLLASVAFLGCRARRSTTSVDAAPHPTASFTLATFKENHGVDVWLSWPILTLSADRGAAMSSTIERSLRADAQEVIDEYGIAKKSAGAAGGEWLDGRFVHIVCEPTLVAPDLVSVACRHAWNRGDVPNDHNWVTTYAWSTAKGAAPFAIDDLVGVAGRQPLAKLVWTALKEKGATFGCTVDDVARNDLVFFFFDRGGVTFVMTPYGNWTGDLTVHLDWVQLRSATHASIVDQLETAAQSPHAVTHPFVAPFRADGGIADAKPR
ncbi:MAG: hypothetical protein ACXWUG_00295 [Polyangiales bacterium]